MRKFLLSAIALLMTATMLAVGNGSGSSQANAIDFDWDGVSKPKVGTTSWYSIKLSELNNAAEDPTVALYLTNLTNETANVDLTGNAILKFPFPLSMFIKDIDLMQLAGTNATEHYSIAGKKHVVWTMPTTYDLSSVGEGQAKEALTQLFGDLSRVSLIQLVEYGLNVYLSINSDQEIAVSADVYETAEIIDDACTKAVDFDWAGVTVTAGEKWFYLDLNAVKNTDKKLNFVVENNGGADANVAFDLYSDCPASAILLDYDWTIAAGGEMKEALGRFFLDQMKKDYVYLKLTTDQTITLKAEEEVLPPPVELFNPSVAPALEIGKEYVLNGETVLKVNLDVLKAPVGHKTVCKIVNPNAVAVNLKQEIAFSTPVTSNNVQEKNLLVVEDTTLDISSKMIANVKSDVAYFRLTTVETLNLVIEYVKLETTKPSTPSDPSTPSAPAIMAPSCDESYAFDWNSSVKQKALMTKWYELDITSLKQNKEHVQLSFTNHHNSVVLVMGSILLDCASTDTIPFVCPVPAGMSISKVLDYSLLAASPLGKAYVSLTMMPTTAKSLADFASVRSQADLMNFVSLNFDAEIEIKAKRISALVDPSYCEATYQTFEKGVEYNLEPGKTQWYRVTDEFLKNDLGLLQQLSIINNGKKDANVTFGVTLDCQYGISTTISQTVPTWFDLTSYYPNGLFRLVDAIVAEDITEFYLSITADQPMVFGFDVNLGTMLGCDDAIRFNWEKGAVINRFDAQWYNFDLNDIKGSGKHLKLTFTNPTNEIVWVASMASLTCPLKVVAPAIVPVLPGMSVDKVIDYSFVATNPINNVYVAVVASDKLELGAALIDATVEEPVSCINHVEVKSGERYIHKPGTTWYKFSNDLLAQMGSAPRFTFENLSANTITLSAGMTVDCQYGILTKAKAKIPAQVFGKPLHNREFGVRIPREFFQAVRKLIDKDVTELMIQLTANNPFAFSIDMQATNGCVDAQEFSWKGCFDLEANKDAWYLVDVNKALKSTEPISVGLYNNTNSPVTITAEVSPTCPAVFSMTEKFVLGAYDTIEVSVQPAKIQELVKDYSKYLNNMSCYARFHADGDVTVCVNDSKEPVTPPNPDEPCCPEECEGVTPLDWRMVTLSQVELNKLYKLDITGLYNQNTINFFVNNDLQKGDVWVESEIYKHCQEAPIAQHSNKVAAGFSMAQVAHDKFAALVDAKQCCMFVKFTSMDTVPVTPPTPCTPYEVKDDVYMCEGQSYVWPVNGVTYTDNAYVKEPGKDASGCDVTYILDLTVAAGQTKSVEVCEGDLPYIYKEVDGTEHSLATVGLHEITLVDGCSMYIDLSTKDCEEEPKPCYETTTIVVNDVCDGTEFVDPITGEKHIISTLIPSTLTWNDTVKTGLTCDSIYTYVVDPIVAPEMLTKEELVAIGAAPVLIAGELVVTDGTEDIIKAHYNAQTGKNIAHVESVVWTAGVDAKLACDATEHTMVLTIYAGCEFVVSGTYVFGAEDIISVAIKKTTETATICEGETYPWNGEQLSEAGTYPMEVTNAAGCVVEIKTLELIVNAAEKVTLAAVSVCDSYEWHGVTYTESGEYTYTDGCKTEVLPLTITKSETVTLAAVSVCDSYEWHGVTYTESGEYTYTDGCKTEVLPLTITKSETVEETIVVCDSYEWHGVTYTESGEYTYTEECKTEVLKLTVNAPVTEDVTVTECYAYTWNGETYTETGDYTYTTVAANGCDSIVNLHLTITAETPEDNPALGEAEAVVKYGNRMIVLHLNDFAANYGWTPANGQVTWYQVVGEIDNSWEIVDDQVLGTGMYIENLDGFAGQIYAIIDSSNADACGNLYRTNVLDLTAIGFAPKLMPTVARPNENLHLLNLNSSEVTEVRVFSTSGELMETYNAEQVSEFVFKAATLPGYYLVEVQHNGEQTTLRYIVK